MSTAIKAYSNRNARLGDIMSFTNLKETAEKIDEFKTKFEEATTFNKSDVEIFSAGVWNGDEYTEKDLDEIVESFQEIGGIIKPYLKLGHNKEQKLLQKDGMPSAGWITNLKRKGDKLLADFKSIPKKIKELIDKDAYGRFSSEIYWNLKIDDKKYKKVLKAVALLGADTPAVRNLDDFINLYIEDREFEELKEYHDMENNMPDGKFLEELQGQVREYSEKIKEYEKNEISYTQNIADLETQVKELTEKIETKELEKKEFEIKSYIDIKISEGKVLPAQVEKFTELAKKDFDSVKEIIESLPKQVDLSQEKSEVVETAEKDFDKEVQNYVDEHKVTYAEAYNAVYKNGGDE